MTIGALLVAGLVGWALTRTVEAPTSVASGYEQFPTSTAPTTPGAAPSISETSGTTPPPDTPVSSASAPITAVPSSGPIGDRSTVARMAAEDLRQKVNSGQVTLIDVRGADAFATGHIPGAINIPFASMEGMVDTIPKGKQIVTYCT